jgi:hypothetical protein
MEERGKEILFLRPTSSRLSKITDGKLIIFRPGFAAFHYSNRSSKSPTEVTCPSNIVDLQLIGTN